MNTNWQETFEDLLPRVVRPVRYTDAELHAVTRRDARVRVALVFPDTYEIGMSNYGLRVLYHIVNTIEGAWAERAFLPWVDMLEHMRERGIPLHSLETRTPLREFDMVGITLQSELGYTNVLAVLELAGIALRAVDRNSGDPVIVGGGPCTVNPLPLTPFFDAFLVGDGEDAIAEMVEVMSRTADRAERIAGLAEIEGVWVPAIHGKDRIIKRRAVDALETADAPVGQVVPFAETEHDRFVIEIGRGCLRGCRFCQAGFCNRPSRYRSADDIADLAAKGIAVTGWQELSLLSFAVSDYPDLCGLLDTLDTRLAPTRTSISLPSFRGEEFNEELGRRLMRIKKSGLTFAPETASPRMKKVINKNVSNDQIAQTVQTAARLGWRRVKLYFMVGLPGETPEDIDMNIEFIRDLARSVKGLTVNVHTTSFIPKPHTPFQWARFADLYYLEDAIARFKAEIGLRRVRVKWGRPEPSLIEAVLARGDERLADVLEEVLQRGGYFQEWSEHFSASKWREAMASHGLGATDYTGERNVSESLPWDFIHTGLDKKFLADEYRKALAAEVQPDCITGPCYDCGLGCEPREPASNVCGETAKPSVDLNIRIREGGRTRNVLRYRLKFAVTRALRYASHLDLVRTIYRLLRRSALPVAYTEGFSPHPRVSFGFPKPVGVTSRGEYADVILSSRPHGDVVELLTPHLPRGLEILACRALLPGTPAITKAADVLHYEITPPPGLDEVLLERRANAAGSVHHVAEENGRLSLILADARRVKLWEVLASLYEIPSNDARALSAERVDAYIMKGSRLLTPLEESFT